MGRWSKRGQLGNIGSLVEEVECIGFITLNIKSNKNRNDTYISVCVCVCEGHKKKNGGKRQTKENEVLKEKGGGRDGDKRRS